MNDAVKQWRRRAAGLQIYHGLAIGSTIILVLVTTFQGIYAALTSERQIPIWSLIPIFLGISLVVYFIRLRRLYQYCWHTLAPIPLDLSNIQELRRFISILKDQREGVDVSFHLDTRRRAPLAEVIQSRRHVFILLRFDAVHAIHKDPTSLVGVLWHELGHAMESDTTLGGWTFRFNQVIAAVTFLIFLVAIGVLILLLIFAPNGALTISLVLSAVGLYLVAVFFGVRFWRRFAEYNCDLLAAAMGYGPELAKYLQDDAGRKRFLTRFMDPHPPNRKRLARLKELSKTLGDCEVLSYSAQPLRISVADYVLGACKYVLPMFAVFQSASFVLAHYSRVWLERLK